MSRAERWGWGDWANPLTWIIGACLVLGPIQAGAGHWAAVGAVALLMAVTAVVRVFTADRGEER